MRRALVSPHLDDAVLSCFAALGPGSSVVTSVTPHGRSGSLLFSVGSFNGTTAGQMCCVTDTASSNGFDP